MFPLQAGSTEPGAEPDLAMRVLHFPFLVGVVEFDGGGPCDFKVAKVV